MPNFIDFEVNVAEYCLYLTCPGGEFGKKDM